MADPLHIDRNGHRTWLKWHRARRRASDPVFTGARILEGMRLGASVEVDLVVHGDHGCAVLHNFELDEETTGTGLVREASAETIRTLNLRDNRGAVLPDKVMLLEDLCALLVQDAPAPGALLQLDFKEELAALDDKTMASFAASVTPIADALILSGVIWGPSMRSPRPRLPSGPAMTPAMVTPSPGSRPAVTSGPSSMRPWPRRRMRR